MQQLHLVGFTTDLEGLIFSARRGAKSGSFVVPLDDKLVATIAEAHRRRNGDNAETPLAEVLDNASPARPPRPPRPESALTPREIQGRLRTGRTIAEVAREAGVDPEWVERWSAPVMAEQAKIVARARGLTYGKPRRGDSAEPLGRSVAWNVANKGVWLPPDQFDRAWSAYQSLDRWVVRFRYRSRGRDHEAEWLLDDDELVALDRVASQLGYVDRAQARRAIPRVEPPEPEPAPASPPPTPTPTPRRRRRRRTSTAKTAASATRTPAASVTKRAPRKKTAGKKTAARQPARKATTKKAVAKHTTKRAAAKKATTAKATAKKKTAKKATANKTTAKKATAKRGTAKRATAKRATAKKAAARKATRKAPKKAARRSGSAARTRRPRATRKAAPPVVRRATRARKAATDMLSTQPTPALAPDFATSGNPPKVRRTATGRRMVARPRRPSKTAKNTAGVEEAAAPEVDTELPDAPDLEIVPAEPPEVAGADAAPATRGDDGSAAVLRPAPSRWGRLGRRRAGGRRRGGDGGVDGEGVDGVQPPSLTGIEGAGGEAAQAQIAAERAGDLVAEGGGVPSPPPTQPAAPRSATPRLRVTRRG